MSSGTMVQAERAGLEQSEQAPSDERVPHERRNLAVPVKTGNLAFAGLLGLEHRLVGVAEWCVKPAQLFFRLDITGHRDADGRRRTPTDADGRRRTPTDADGRRNVQHMSIADERHRRAQHDLVRDGEELRIIRVDQQHREVVATKTGEDIGGANKVVQPFGEADQDLIPGLMLEGVVDGFEAVEVDVENRDAG